MFPQKLKTLRNQLGYSQKEISDIIGISQQSYARWESGKFTPNLASLENLASSLNVPVAYFVSEESIELESLLDNPSITFNGKPLDDTDKQAILNLLKSK